MTAPAHRLAGRALVGLVAFVLLASVFLKLTATPESEMGRLFQAGGVWEHRHLLAVLEVAVVALLLWRRTSALGVVAAFGYWSGAVATHLTHGLPLDVQPAMAALTVAAGYFHTPELFARALGRPLATPSEPSPVLDTAADGAVGVRPSAA